MAMKKKPVTGMKDILPKEMAIRVYREPEQQAGRREREADLQDPEAW